MATNDSINVCVIGAGAAGLCVARHFSRLSQLFTVDIIEQAANIGDTWATNFQQHEANTQANLPKDILAFPDFPFDPHLPSFLSYSDILKYLQQYTDYFQLMPLIQFNTTVVQVKPKGTECQPNPIGDELHPSTGSHKKTFSFSQWTITTQNLITGQNMVETYDAVVVCNGHYPTRLMFDTDSLEYFASGKFKTTNKQNTLSDPLADISCLQSDCGILVTNGNITSLYKHVFNAVYPSMAFVGINLTALPFPCYDLQARWLFAVWTGLETLPSTDKMLSSSDEDYTSWLVNGLPTSQYTHLLSTRQWDYFSELAKMGASQPIDHVVQKLYDAVYQYKVECSTGYKDFQLSVTGHSSFLQPSENNSTKRLFRVAVIGAGVSGLCAARHCCKFPNQMSVTVYEQGASIGGTWIYTPDTETDEMGLPVHSSMYEDLHADFPHELMAYHDFPFPPNVSTFAAQQDVLQYLEDYCEHYSLNQHIKFRHRVECVSLQDEDNKSKPKWKIQVTDLINNVVHYEEYDAVFVGNGHFTKPFIPQMDGLEKIPSGNVIHSHTFRKLQPYKNCVVLVVGGGISGKDITRGLSTVAKEVVWSTKEPCDGDYPKNVTHYPCIQHIDDDQVVHFVNGAYRKVDKIILCTGYEYSFPFLDDSCGFSVINKYKIWPLYKNTFNARYPTMCFLAMMRPITFIYRDLQIMWVLRVWLGLQQLPSMDEMIADCNYETHSKNNMLTLYKELAEYSETRSPTPAFAGLLMHHFNKAKKDHPGSKRFKYHLMTSKHWIKFKELKNN